MWGTVFGLIFGIAMYFWDIGFDILVAREQSIRAYSRHDLQGKVKKIHQNPNFLTCRKVGAIHSCKGSRRVVINEEGAQQTTSDAGSQYRFGRVGGGIQPPASLQPVLF